MATSDKYDRQLRLWGPTGQRKLMKSHILLIGADAVGTETLKNLVLPGIGNFTVLDDHIVQQSDLGTNFFVESSTLGKPRAEVVASLLCEMNEDVKGFAKVANFQNLLDKEPEFFHQFNLIIAANLPQTCLCLLSNYCSSRNTPLMAVRSYGLIGSLRMQLTPNYHFVIDSKEDNENMHDLRLSHPFPELIEYCEGFDLPSLPSNLHSHVPYVAILYQAGKALENGLGRKLTRKDMAAFKQKISSMANNPNEENFQEALRDAHRYFDVPRLRDELSEVMNELREKTLTATDSIYAFMIVSLAEYLDTHDQLPPLESVPDMHSTSEYFLALQEVFRKKAQQEFDDFRAILQRRLQEVGLSIDSFSEEEIHIFAKKAKGAVALKTTTIAEEYNLDGEVSSQTSETLTEALYGERATDPLQTPIVWYLALRGADSFYAANARWPGDVKQESALSSDQDAVFDKMRGIAAVYNVPEDLIESVTSSSDAKMETDGAEGEFSGPLITRNHAIEITRYGGAELHTISALIGGMAAQEAVKVLTNLYVPVNNTYIFNGVASIGASYRL